MKIETYYKLTNGNGESMTVSAQEYEEIVSQYPVNAPTFETTFTEAPLRTANPPAFYNTMTPSVPPGEHEPENPAP